MGVSVRRPFEQGRVDGCLYSTSALARASKWVSLFDVRLNKGE